MNTKTTAREFFFQLGAMAALYAGAIALINLLFNVIDTAFPKANEYYGYFYTSSPISLPVATLIIIFPLFLFLSWTIQKSYQIDPSLKESGLRKWLVYVTLFLAGLAVAIDLISLLYQFLDGQEITNTFLLKVLTVFVVAGGVFMYYLQDIQNKLTEGNRNIWRVFAFILVFGSILSGFAVIGSPATQRAYRLDSQRTMHLEGIQWQVVNYWQQKGMLPGSLADLASNSISGWQVPSDPVTGMPYKYEKIEDKSFRVCATFAKATPKELPYSGPVSRPVPVGDSGIKGPSSWQHEAGEQCFTRTIDSDFYPPRKGI